MFHLVFAVLVSALLPSPALASAEPARIVCKRLDHALDGDDEIVTIQRNARGTYDVSYYRKNSGEMRDPSLANKETTVELASDLGNCAFAKDEPRIMGCSRYHRESGAYSGVHISQRIVRSAPREAGGGQQVESRFVVTISSPVIRDGKFADGIPKKTGENHEEVQLTFHGDSGRPPRGRTSECRAE